MDHVYKLDVTVWFPSNILHWVLEKWTDSECTTRSEIKIVSCRLYCINIRPYRFAHHEPTLGTVAAPDEYASGNESYPKWKWVKDGLGNVATPGRYIYLSNGNGMQVTGSRQWFPIFYQSLCLYVHLCISVCFNSFLSTFPSYRSKHSHFSRMYGWYPFCPSSWKCGGGFGVCQGRVSLSF